jgi:DNA-damage-inducible protein J
MSKAAMVRARLEPALKIETEGLLRQLGLTASQAITLFYRQITLHKGLPFEVVLPNAKTRKTFAATDAGKGVVRAKNAGDLFRKLGV